MTGEPDLVPKNDRLRNCIILTTLFLAGLIPLLATPIIPSIDFYTHIARFFVLAHIDRDPLLQIYYQADWPSSPDIAWDAISAPLLAFVSPLLAGHLIAAGMFAALYFGVLYFNRVLGGRWSLLTAILLLPLFYSYIFNWGFGNFLIGLALAFWGAGWWIARRDRPRVAVPISCLISIFIFFMHGIAFALYGIVIVALEIGIFLDARDRRVATLARSLLLTSVQAIIPFAVFAYWIVGRIHGGAFPELTDFSPQIHMEPRVVELSARILRRLIPILRVEEGPAYWFDILTFAIQACALGLLLSRGTVRIPRFAWPLLAAAGVLVIVGLPRLLGVSFITDRMPLFMALCLLGVLLRGARQWDLADRLAVGTIALVVLIRLAAIAENWSSYGQPHREFQSVASQIPRGSMVMQVMVGAGDHETEVPRCEMYGPLLIAQHGQIGWLFADKDQHPLDLTGPLRKAVITLHKNFVSGGRNEYGRYMAVAAQAGFEYMLICNAHLLNETLPPSMTVMARTPNFVLLHAKVP